MLVTNDACFVMTGGEDSRGDEWYPWQNMDAEWCVCARVLYCAMEKGVKVKRHQCRTLRRIGTSLPFRDQELDLQFLIPLGNADSVLERLLMKMMKIFCGSLGIFVAWKSYQIIKYFDHAATCILSSWYDGDAVNHTRSKGTLSLC